MKGFKFTIGKTSAVSRPVDMDADGPPPDPNREVKIKRELDGTKKFLSDQPDLANRMTELINDATMQFWVASGRVSHYYLVMSPLVARACDLTRLEEKLWFCAQLYTQHITEPIKEYFQELFQAEYGLAGWEIWAVLRELWARGGGYGHVIGSCGQVAGRYEQGFGRFWSLIRRIRTR